MDHKNNEFNSRFNGVKVHPNAFVDPSAELHDGVIVSQGDSKHRSISSEDSSF